ncbi:MAG: tryptophan synthase subunit alpha [Deltaproteobacteria bacterium]|nr:tryptophan synthase subunit alpha [Deltaproteobacteria bacterium]NIS76978.1 tryptophan synthase subunit alpha [Deltaproteobacteria bacterium]
MNRIAAKFQSLRERKEKGLVIYLTAGDPDMETSLELFLCAAVSGADILEVGIPFSDPMADGPVIQRAFGRALGSGCSLKKTLNLVRKLREIVDTPVVLFGYLNPILAYGAEYFFRDCKSAGVDGILIVDLPLEEWGNYRRYADAHDIAWIGLVTPASGERRTKVIADGTSGFVYVVSVTGITGTRNRLPGEYKKAVRLVKKSVDTPVVVGFGISTPEMAQSVARVCDGVVIGSACVKMVEKYKSNREALIKNIAAFVEKTKLRIRDGNL